MRLDGKNTCDGKGKVLLSRKGGDMWWRGKMHLYDEREGTGDTVKRGIHRMKTMQWEERSKCTECKEENLIIRKEVHELNGKRTYDERKEVRTCDEMKEKNIIEGNDYMWWMKEVYVIKRKEEQVLKGKDIYYGMKEERKYGGSEGDIM
jgi:hypothetical protein